MNQNFLPFLKLIPAYLLIIFIAGFSLWKISNLNSLKNWQIKQFVIQQNQKLEVPPKSEFLFGKPKRIVIPNLKIDTEIAEGNYIEETKVWKISNQNAFYASLAALPNNQEGNTIIYGHNSQNIFGSTKNLKEGDGLFVYTENDLVFEYTYTSSEVTKPNDTKIFDYHGQPILTLITCTGLLNENRRLSKFDLVSVKK